MSSTLSKNSAGGTRRVYLEDYQHKTEPVYDLLRLIACPALETESLARELARKRDTLDKEDIEFIETVLVYKLPKLSREEIRTDFNRNQDEHF